MSRVDFVEAVKTSIEAKTIIDFIEYRFKRGYSTLILVVGARGTGKSSTCYRLSEKTNERLNPIRKKMGLKEREFGTLTDSHLGNVKWVRDSQMGDDSILEEISVLYPSRRSMSEENVGVSKILDIIRKKRLIIFANCPVALASDKNIRSSANALILTHHILKSEQVVWSKFWKLQLNYLSGKVYTHKFTNQGRDIDFMYTKMPNMERWKAYEQSKDDFMEDHYAKLIKKAQLKEDKELKELGYTPTIKKELTEQQEKIYLLKIQGLNQEEIAEKVGIAQPNVSKQYKLIQKKGYSLTNPVYTPIYLKKGV